MKGLFESSTGSSEDESSETREGENDVDSVLTEVSDDMEEAEENVVRTRITRIVRAPERYGE
jgi:hypothetical protein